MTPAANCNMLDFRMMYGRAESHDVSEATYSDKHCAFGRCPIVIHLGDFLQLSPTNQLGLLTNANARREDGSRVFQEPPTAEVQHACALFQSIRTVVELKGTKRFAPGDPLIKFLECMRAGKRFPPGGWRAFQGRVADDLSPEET